MPFDEFVLGLKRNKGKNKDAENGLQREFASHA